MARWARGKDACLTDSAHAHQASRSWVQLAPGIRDLLLKCSTNYLLAIQEDAQAAAADAMEQTGLAVDHQEDLSAALDDKAASLQQLQDDLACVMRERDAAAQQASHLSCNISSPEDGYMHSEI